MSSLLPRPFFRFDAPVHGGIVSVALGAAALMPAAAAAQSAPAQAPAVSVEAGLPPSTYQPVEMTSPKLGGVAPQDLPQTVTIVTEQLMKDQNATTLREALRNVPGITFNAGEGGAQGDMPVVRGFSGQSDMYIDGVRDSGSYKRDTFNMESVEVLKGPSSTLFGRGSTGGAINQVSKTAKLQDINEVTVGVGTADFYRTTADVNKKLSDTAAVRLNVMAQDTGVAGRDEVFRRGWGVAPTIGIGLGTNTEAHLSYLHQQDRALPDLGVPLVNGRKIPGVGDDKFYGLRHYDYEEHKVDLGTMRVRHQFDAPVELTNTTRWMHVNRDQSPSFANSINVAAGTHGRNKTPAANRENRILANQTDVKTEFATGPLKHTLNTGLELSAESYRTKNRTAAFSGGLGTGSLYTPDPNATGGLTLTPSGWSEGKASSIGAYAMDRVQLSEQWEVTGGIRYDHFDADFKSNSIAGLSSTDDLLSYRGSLSFKPDSTQHYYIAYGSSFNPSAENLSLANNTAGLDPEKSTLYEIGAKWSLMGGQLTPSVALFRVDKTNMRVADPNDPNALQLLEGERRVQGIDIGITGRVLPDLDVMAGYTFQKSETVKTTTPEQMGKEVQLTPEHAASLWATYHVTPKFSASAGLTYVGKQFADATETTSIEAYTLVDAAANYALTEQVDLQLNVNNIFDNRAITTGNASRGELAPGRSAILTTRVKF